LVCIRCSLRTIGEFWPASITPVSTGPPMADPAETRRKQGLASQLLGILSARGRAGSPAGYTSPYLPHYNICQCSLAEGPNPSADTLLVRDHPEPLAASLSRLDVHKFMHHGPLAKTVPELSQIFTPDPNDIATVSPPNLSQEV
jgi:hypothetical protein